MYHILLSVWSGVYFPLPGVTTATVIIIVALYTCSNRYWIAFKLLLSKTALQSRHAGEGGRRPSFLSVGGAGGAKAPFLNAMICFLIGNMIQRRSYKLKAANI